MDRNPYRIVYSYMPSEDSPEYGIVHDHAYWVSNLQLNDATLTLTGNFSDGSTRAIGITTGQQVVTCITLVLLRS